MKFPPQMNKHATTGLVTTIYELSITVSIADFGQTCRVPPAGEVLLWSVRVVSVVRDVVEEHQPGAHRVFEVQDVEAGGRLVQPVAVAARVETQQTADDEPKRSFMRNYQHIFILMVDYHLTDNRQGARQYTDARFASLGCKCKRVRFPGAILFGEAFFHFLASQALPVAVTDLT